MIVRSRVILPITRPPIENGAVEISGSRISAVGSWDELKHSSSGEVVDLGDSILLPGFVNAHCHLDYTHMSGMIAPTKHFVDWVKAMLAVKAGWSYSDYAASWVDGAKMLLQSGTTTVADIEAVPELLPDVWSTTPLRVHSFLELTGVRSGRLGADILREALERIAQLSFPRKTVSLSPHAPYSTRSDLLELVAAHLREKAGLATMHVAESEAEYDMFQYRRGPFYELLKTQRDVSDCGGISPIQQVGKCGLLSSGLLAVHVNYAAPGDAELLAASRCSVVHCPRSHAYFSHRDFPFDDLSRAGVNICLGTDSLVTVITSRKQPTKLSMFAEMQRFAQVHSRIAPSRILQMATSNGARALRLAGEIGELAPNACADMIALPFSGNISDAESAVINHAGDISRCLIDGHWQTP